MSLLMLLNWHSQYRQRIVGEQNTLTYGKRLMAREQILSHLLAVFVGGKVEGVRWSGAGNDGTHATDGPAGGMGVEGYCNALCRIFIETLRSQTN